MAGGTVPRTTTSETETPPPELGQRRRIPATERRRDRLRRKIRRLAGLVEVRRDRITLVARRRRPAAGAAAARHPERGLTVLRFHDLRDRRLLAHSRTPLQALIFDISRYVKSSSPQAVIRRIRIHTAPAVTAEAGMVRIHAQTIRPATPQRTAEKRWIAPTPMIAPLIVCVVLTGMPPIAVPRSVIAPAASAQNPPTGRSLVMRIPIVFTMRQPPAIVPRPIAACAARITQNGT